MLILLLDSIFLRYPPIHAKRFQQTAFAVINHKYSVLSQFSVYVLQLFAQLGNNRIKLFTPHSTALTVWVSAVLCFIRLVFLA